MLFTPHQATGTPGEVFAPRPGPAAGTYAYPWNPAAPDVEQSSVRPTAGDDDLDDDDETETDMVPGFEPTSYSAAGPHDSDHPTA
jgi:hypothetical protein